MGLLHAYAIEAAGLPCPWFGAEGRPSWLALDGDVLSGTPGPGEGGPAGPVRAIAANLAGADEQQFTITVAEAPSITSTAPTVARVGDLCSYAVDAVGHPPPVRQQVSSVRLTVTDDKGATGTGAK